MCPQKWTSYNKRTRAGVHKSGQAIINERAKVSTNVDKTITLNIYELSSARHGAKVVFDDKIVKNYFL